ncbi:Lcl C-terminal domain-containing protein [Vitreoscilla filiformis]|uniref:Lcl C-terminal domain-containing protein n=1 Tax=Vitreoscilla filiformis TaxID=63 RepID=UPI0012FDAEA3|nr:DUF1566 domain-containing protein [Vitreoscilla filiformis]
MQQVLNRGAQRPGWPVRGVVMMALAGGLAGCGGGDGGSSDEARYGVGGTLSGLASGGSVVVQLNGANTVTLTANGSFVFGGTLATGTAYVVAIKTQPSGQACTVAHGSGTLAGRAVNDVAVTCADTPAATGKLPDTGITASQCYAVASDALVSCTSAAAKALNPAQDGMTGRDVTSSSNADGKLGFSYTKIAADGSTLPASATTWDCVKDNITGLMWEVKTADGGLRDVNKTYTHYTSTTEAQFWNGSAYVPPTQAQIDAATNTVGYVAAVNAAGLCGKTDWRLPTVDELQGLVDYGVDYTTDKPMIDETYFPNTAVSGDTWGWGGYWASSPVVGSPDSAWYVNFGYGDVYGNDRGNTGHVRLVR